MLFCMLTWKYLYITVMALVGFSASAVQALTYQNGDYMGSLNKKASGAQCFIMALGLFWDIITGLPWTPNGVGSLGPRGYCIFLPGAHYLTINSPYGADSLLNKLLLLLLLPQRLSLSTSFFPLICSPNLFPKLFSCVASPFHAPVLFSESSNPKSTWWPATSTRCHARRTNATGVLQCQCLRYLLLQNLCYIIFHIQYKYLETSLILWYKSIFVGPN